MMKATKAIGLGDGSFGDEGGSGDHEEAHSSEQAELATYANEVADALEELSSVVEDRCYSGKVDRVVGYEVDSRRARLSFPAKKGAMLREAFRWLVSQPVVDTGIVSSLLAV